MIIQPLTGDEKTALLYAAERIRGNLYASGDAGGGFERARDIKTVSTALPSLLAEVEANRLRGWRPIETAPEDDSLFLVWIKTGSGVSAPFVYRGDILKRSMSVSTPAHLRIHATHWMPAPSPPSGGGL